MKRRIIQKRNNKHYRFHQIRQRRTRINLNKTSTLIKTATGLSKVYQTKITVAVTLNGSAGLRLNRNRVPSS